MQGIFQKENTDKALKYGIYRHLPTYEKIIRNLVSFYIKIFLPVLVFRRHLDLPFFFSITWEHINIYDYLWVKLRAKARGFTTHWINISLISVIFWITFLYFSERASNSASCIFSLFLTLVITSAQPARNTWLKIHEGCDAPLPRFSDILLSLYLCQNLPDVL